MIIVSIGLFCIVVSVLIYLNQWLENNLISHDNREKYILLSKKPKDLQTEEERKFIWNNQNAYVTSKIRSICLQIGVALLMIGLLINFITK